MTTLGTTSIDSLPNNNNNNNNVPVQNDNNGQNIKIENYGQQLEIERGNDKLSQQPMDYSAQLNSTLKEATISGATNLPSKDIPQNTLPLQQDQNIKQNYIPDKSNDYIGDIINREKILRENTQKQNYSDNLDYIYEQLQVPLIISIMYFIFQLPALRKNIFTFLPYLFNKDGNPNLYGYLFNSIAFGLLYFLINKSISYVKQ